MENKSHELVLEGRTLGEWLLQLVGEDQSNREIAAKVITDEIFAPSLLFPLNEAEFERRSTAFLASVRSAVNAVSFPKDDFARRFLRLYLQLYASWSEAISVELAGEFEGAKKPSTQHEWVSARTALTGVTQGLDVEFLPARAILREMLANKSQSHIALDIIARMGKAGSEFYEDLLSELGGIMNMIV